MSQLAAGNAEDAGECALVERSGSLPSRSGSRITPSSGRGSFISTDRDTDLQGLRADSNKLDEAYVPPWTEPYIIGMAGTSGSGKTSISTKIIQEINTPWTVLLSLDNFYKVLTPEQKEAAHRSEYDFDHPDAVDLDEAYECVLSLKEGRKTDIPIYSFVEHAKTDQVITIYGANVIIVEGLYTLYSEKLRSLMNIMIYVDTDLDICLARRLNRDILYRGRDLKSVLDQWTRTVKPNAERYVKPTMKYADLIIPRGSENIVGIDLLIQHIKKQLLLKSESHLAKLEKLTGKKEVNSKNYPNLILLDKTNQLKGIYTILINKDTPRDDFVFYFDRVATILINKALELNSFKDITIETPLNVKFDTVAPSETVIAVNIIRSGDCFMHSLRKTIPEIAIGKLLIQSDSTTGEPQLHTNALPKDLEKGHRKILLLEAQIISGAAVIMAIQVLIDHGVSVDDITVVCYLASEIGLSRILKAFKQVKVVVAEIGYRNNLENQTWFRKAFIDEKYFGT